MQIRTHDMHKIAELGVAATGLTNSVGNAISDGKQYRWVRELLDILESAQKPDEFLEHTKLELFQERVFCFNAKRRFD